jgi:hypothetical protein
MHLDIAKSYQIIYDAIVKADASLELDPDSSFRVKAFENFVFYLMLAPYSNERTDLLLIVEKNY